MTDTATTTRWVYAFGAGRADGDASMKNLLGGKGANLAEMSSLGLPVPPGFTLTTEACVHYYQNGKSFPAGLEDEVASGLAEVERQTGKRFGDAENPLLVSVRSGARASMPGMMDTVLNLGLNDQTVEGLARLSGDRRFAFDSYRRFIQMYSDVVLGLDHHTFEEILDDHKDRLMAGPGRARRRACSRRPPLPSPRPAARCRRWPSADPYGRPGSLRTCGGPGPAPRRNTSG